MAGIDLKGSAVIGDNPRGARVVNGRLRVRLVARTPPGREGYGSAQLKAGVASKGQVEILSGAVKVRFD